LIAISSFITLTAREADVVIISYQILVNSMFLNAPGEVSSDSYKVANSSHTASQLHSAEEYSTWVCLRPQDDKLMSKGK
jgi:hypothetical protein